MPQSYAAKIELMKENGPYWNSTLGALIELSKDVANEAFDDINWVESLLRKGLAQSVKNNPKSHVQRFMQNMVLRPDFPEVPTDTDFKNYASAEWDTLADIETLRPVLPEILVKN